MKTCIIFGGTGFIGSYFAEQILRDAIVEKVILADIKAIDEKRFLHILQPYLISGAVEYLPCDVRKPIAEQLIGEKEHGSINLIANFAAIHREPGHQLREFYETNLPGAENVCQWASEVDCQDIIFTSSIAPYGPGEEAKTEQNLPLPLSPYGASKLVAEKIHRVWQAKSQGHNLTIVRPGVVFGPGEGGNVSRLIKATLQGYFFYMGNKNTRKAGVYVRELTQAMLWAHERGRENQNGCSLFNMSMASAPSVSDYVNMIQKVSNKTTKWVPNIPFGFLYPISFLIEGIAYIFGINQPISPVRLKKLLKSNDIVPEYLLINNYQYKYTLETAFEEWQKVAPDEWLC